MQCNAYGYLGIYEIYYIVWMLVSVFEKILDYCGADIFTWYQSRFTKVQLVVISDVQDCDLQGCSLENQRKVKYGFLHKV